MVKSAMEENKHKRRFMFTCMYVCGGGSVLDRVVREGLVKMIFVQRTEGSKGIWVKKFEAVSVRP